jgi:hypothetical protein
VAPRRFFLEAKPLKLSRYPSHNSQHESSQFSLLTDAPPHRISSHHITYLSPSSAAAKTQCLYPTISTTTAQTSSVEAASTKTDSQYSTAITNFVI